MAFAGFSMINNVEVALRTNAVKIPKDTIMKNGRYREITGR